MSASGVDLSSCLDLAARVARDAGEVILSTGRAVEHELERDRKVRADRTAEDRIVANLRGATSYSVLTEESGNFGGGCGDWRWIVDPLDGSVNFSQSIPLCAVSIALWKNDEPVLGVVFDFNHDELFTGRVGVGAALNGAPINVSPPSTRHEAIFCTGFPAAGDFSDAALSIAVRRARDFKKVRLLGSAAVSLAYVAAGRAHAYAEEGIRLWDVAAGLALVRAAGGVIHCEPTGCAETYTVAAGCCGDVLPEMPA